MEKKFKTNYDVAVHWLGNNYILCNNIHEIDNSVYDNMRFDLNDEDEGTYSEIFQWFISSCSKRDVEYLEEHFDGVYFTYSDMLDCYILCVTHWGTAWDYVETYTDNKYAKRELGQSK